MCRLIAADGGDVFKFAGDACIVLWPNTDTMDQRLKRAVQCAYAIQDLLDDAMMGDMVEKGNGEKTDVQLSVKCGIGMGNVSVLHIGGECEERRRRANVRSNFPTTNSSAFHLIS